MGAVRSYSSLCVEGMYVLTGRCRNCSWLHVASFFVKSSLDVQSI